MSSIRNLLAAVVFCGAALPAMAVTPAAYRQAGVVLPPGAAVPVDVIVKDESGRQQRMGDLISRPAVLVFADYTCTTLCGPIVAFVSSALEKSKLDPDRFRLVVIGLDPHDTAADAARMRRDHLSGGELAKVTTFATAEKASVRRLTEALGYRYAYDQDHDQFVHPGAAYVLRADGRVARVLTGLGLSGDDMRLALVEAGNGHIGTLGDQIKLLCSGFDPVHGVYNLMVFRVVAATGAATMLVLAVLIGSLVLTDRRRVT